MNARIVAALGGALMMALAGASVAQEGEVPTDCAGYSLSDPVNTAGDTDGISPVELQPGDVFTFTMTPGTATSASWRIVWNGSGDPGSTLVGGGTVSGTLEWTSPNAIPNGVGFYVDSIDGTATITASCSPGAAVHTPQAIPTLSEWGVIVASVVLGLAGLFGVRRRHA